MTPHNLKYKLVFFSFKYFSNTSAFGKTSKIFTELREDMWAKKFASSLPKVRGVKKLRGYHLLIIGPSLVSNSRSFNSAFPRSFRYHLHQQLVFDNANS